MITPTSVSSRLNARPVTPCPRSSISFTMTSASPSTRATPSPTSRMTPMLCLVIPVLAPAICASISVSKLDMDHLSDATLAIGLQGGLNRGKASTDAAVVDVAADSHAHAADQIAVLGELRIDAASKPPRHVGHELGAQIRREGDGAFDMRRVAVTIQPDQALEVTEDSH